LPIEGVTSQLIYDNLRPGITRSIIRKDEVLDVIRRKAKDIEVLITLGAGDLEDYSSRIADLLKQEVNNPK
jgi:UDP-N-acetylmuramate--alanine ligase